LIGMATGFTVVLRGYDRVQVDELLAEADAALDNESEFARAAARDRLLAAKLRISLRGYDRSEVDRAIDQRRQILDGSAVALPASSPTETPMTWDFTVVLRGYERTEVDPLLEAAAATLANGDDTQRATIREALRQASFTVALRGYDRGQVDAAIRELLQS
jgi:DivIVA domain-containing protein